MNFAEMDLGHLIILWQASDGNLPLKAQIETELQTRIAGNSSFSREFIFEISRVRNRALGIEFIPTSDAYQRYGSSIVITMLTTQEEFAELTANRLANPAVNTQGMVRVTIIGNDNLTPEQIATAANIGFHTREIFETS